MIFYFLKKISCFYIFFLLVLDILIILRFVYLSPVFFLIIIFFLYVFNFFYIFLEKNIIFYTLNIFHFTLGLFISFFLFLSLFFYFFSLYFFLKTSYTKIKKWCFIVVIATLFHFSTTLKIILRSYIFLLHTYDFYYILLYISINILIHDYIFYSMSKKCY